MAKLDPPYVLPDFDWSNGFQNDPHTKAFDALFAEAKALPEGTLVGALLRWQRADGYAVYRITNERPFTIQHVPFGDAWTVEPALIRGLTLSDAREMVARERRLSALFGG
jgi:hypothetical protein